MLEEAYCNQNADVVFVFFFFLFLISLLLILLDARGCVILAFYSGAQRVTKILAFSMCDACIFEKNWIIVMMKGYIAGVLDYTILCY